MLTQNSGEKGFRFQYPTRRTSNQPTIAQNNRADVNHHRAIPWRQAAALPRTDHCWCTIHTRDGFAVSGVGPTFLARQDQNPYGGCTVIASAPPNGINWRIRNMTGAGKRCIISCRVIRLDTITAAPPAEGVFDIFPYRHFRRSFNPAALSACASLARFQEQAQFAVGTHGARAPRQEDGRRHKLLLQRCWRAHV